MGAGGDQHGIDTFALGAPQMQFGNRADLQRLQDDPREAGGLQMPGDAAFVASAGFDADGLNACLTQPGGNKRPAGWCIIDGERISAAVDGDVEPVLAGVDAGHPCDIIDHLRLTPPCEIEPAVRATIRVR